MLSNHNEDCSKNKYRHIRSSTQPTSIQNHAINNEGTKQRRKCDKSFRSLESRLKYRMTRSRCSDYKNRHIKREYTSHCSLLIIKKVLKIIETVLMIIKNVLIIEYVQIIMSNVLIADDNVLIIIK